MNKAVFITGLVTYLFGFAAHVTAYSMMNWAGMDWFLSRAPDAAVRGLMWPYLVYEWIRFDAPLI